MERLVGRRFKTLDELKEEIEKIVENAKIKYNVHEISVVHYIGEFYTGDMLFLVAVLGAHRGETLDALKEVIETVKYDVEFKKGNMEYDYEINAETGDIISFDHEID